MDKPYLSVTAKSSISKELLSLALNTPVDQWVPYYNFRAIFVPHELLGLDSFIVNLAKLRKFHTGVLCVEPNTCYNWHVDMSRKVGLNMLLSDDGRSRCLFLDGEPDVVFKTQELKYEPDTYYVFNTQVPHIVLNTEEPRYMFSLEFLEEDRDLTFDELCKDIKGMNHGD
jgi:hypothetical protein